MRPLIRRGTARSQRGSVAVESAFLLPVILTTAMMVFEIARYALIIVIGGLALDTALNGLRQRSDLVLSRDGDVGAIIKAGMLVAAYGYLDADGLSVQTRTYPACPSSATPGPTRRRTRITKSSRSRSSSTRTGSRRFRPSWACPSASPTPIDRSGGRPIARRGNRHDRPSPRPAARQRGRGSRPDSCR